MESVKAAADVYMPVSGEVLEVNEALRNDPALANSDPLGAGWFFKIKLSDAAGKEVGTVDMGSLPGGRYNFAWDASQYQGEGALRFKVLAANGDKSVGSTALMTDKITAVSMDNGSLQMQLSRGGMTTQAGIKAIL